MPDSVDWWSLVPRLLPLASEIEKALATAERIKADPDVTAMLNTFSKVTAIVKQSEKSS